MEAHSHNSDTPGRATWRLWTLVPLLLLGIALWIVGAQGSGLSGLIGDNPPSTDQFDLRRVTFAPGEIRIAVRNPQVDDLTIASVAVDDAIVPFTLDGPGTLKRLRSRTVIVPYDWVADEPISVGVTSSTGIQTTRQIPAAVATPTASARGFLGYGLIGLLVGVIPVGLGMMWLPALRRAAPEWLAAFMALTAGLLTFLGIDALVEAFERQQALPPGLGGPGLVLVGVAVSGLGMTYLSSRLARGGVATGFALALLVAIGIGVHNFGEGLAIGTAFAFGELQLGTFLVTGFMVHNISEGLGIATPVAGHRTQFLALLGLALIAGAPTIAGTWIGGYVANDMLGVLFFALAAGAALQVVIEVGRYIHRRAPGRLGSGWVIGGFLAGISIMWVTGALAG